MYLDSFSVELIKLLLYEIPDLGIMVRISNGEGIFITNVVNLKSALSLMGSDFCIFLVVSVLVVSLTETLLGVLLLQENKATAHEKKIIFLS